MPRRIGVQSSTRCYLFFFRRRILTSRPDACKDLQASAPLSQPVRDRINGYDRIAPGHLEAAQAVALGAADAAVVTCSAALVHGLHFLPLASERVDLVLPKEWVTDPRIQRALETLESRAFRRELDSIGGYQTAQSGRVVAELR